MFYALPPCKCNLPCTGYMVHVMNTYNCVFNFKILLTAKLLLLNGNCWNLLGG